MLDGIGSSVGGFFDGLSDVGSSAWNAMGDAFDGLGHVAGQAYDSLASAGHSVMDLFGGSAGAPDTPVDKPALNLGFYSDKPFEASFKHTDLFQGIPGEHPFDVFDEGSATLWPLRTTDHALHLDFKAKEFPQLGRADYSGALGLDLTFNDAILAFKSTAGMSSTDQNATSLLPYLRSELSYTIPEGKDSGLSLFGNLAHSISTPPNGTPTSQLDGTLNLDWDTAGYETALRTTGQFKLDGKDAGTGSLDLELGSAFSLFDKPFQVTAGGLIGVHSDFKTDGTHTTLRGGPSLGFNISDSEQLNFGYDFLNGVPMLTLSKDY